MATKAIDIGARIVDKARPQAEMRGMVRYYVWDRMVRIGHWTNFVMVAGLVFTGFYIGGPFFRPGTDEPFGASTMATMKNLHFILGVVFTMGGLFRLYWYWGGKTYRQWFRNHLWQKDFWREVGFKLKEYLTLSYTKHEGYTLTHNALAALSYSLLFCACAVITLTGFAMKGQINPGGWLNLFIGWVIPFFGSEASVRMLHRLAMWVIIGFAIHHIAFVLYFEVLAERGLLSSMITGYKTKPADWKPNDKPWEKQ